MDLQQQGRQSGDLLSEKEKTNGVSVLVRIRPLLESERAGGDAVCVRVVKGDTTQEMKDVRHEQDKTQRVLLQNTRVPQMDCQEFSFDGCFGPDASQTDVFEGCRSVLESALAAGYNATIFAYGVTGAGKTHTMQGTHSDRGVISRAVDLILTNTSEIAEARSGSSTPTARVLVSYLEIYNERVFDLLEPKATDLPIREDANSRIVVPGAARVAINSIREFEAIYARGCRNRTVAATRLNSVSSRSHAVLLITVERDIAAAIPGNRIRTRISKIHLIDLAGSEDNRRTQNSGMRMTESGNINKSLFTLSKVVSALNDRGRGVTSVRVPYRDSKMTRFLQDSLGGTARSMMIANIAPTQSGFHGTQGTLLFAAKSREIVNVPIVHEVVEAEPQQSEPRGFRALRRFGQPQTSASHLGPALSVATSDSLLQQDQVLSTSLPSRESGLKRLSFEEVARPVAAAAAPMQKRLHLAELSNAPVRRQDDETEVQAKDATIAKLSQEVAMLRRQVALERASDRAPLSTQRANSSANAVSKPTGTLQIHADPARKLHAKRQLMMGNKLGSRLGREQPIASDAVTSIKSEARQAKEHEEQGRLVSALRCFRRALAGQPDNREYKASVRRLDEQVKLLRSGGLLRAQIDTTGDDESSSDPEFVPSESDGEDTESIAFPTTKQKPTIQANVPGRQQLMTAPQRRPLQALGINTTHRSNTQVSTRKAKRSTKAPVPSREEKNNFRPTPPTEEVAFGIVAQLPIQQPPSTEMTVAAGGSAPYSVEMLLQILNSGSLSQLIRLKGIGAKKAEAIMEFRATRQFAVLDDLRSSRMPGGFGKQGLSTFLLNNGVDRS